MIRLAQFVEVPVSRLEPAVLNAVLEEFASRDGTDYGARERSLEEKVAELRAQLDSGDLALVYDLDSEQWDFCTREQRREFNL